jgi:hypothetical protein
MSQLADLLEKRGKQAEELEQLITVVRDEGREAFTTEEDEKRSALVSEINDLDTRIDEESAKAERSQKLSEARKLAGIGTVDAKVTNEPKVYGHGSQHSYYWDLARRAVPGLSSHDGANERLAQWGHQMAREAHLDSKEGRYALSQAIEGSRVQDERENRDKVRRFREYGEAEFRTPLGTGGGSTATSGGSFGAMVAPVFTDVIPFRQAGRTFADAVAKRPLPDYGMVIQAPTVTAAAGVAAQTEGSGVQETDPTLGFTNATVETLAGQVTVSQQLLDRAGPGYEADQTINMQLNIALAPKVDNYVLTQALAGAGAIALTNGSFVPWGTSGTGGGVSLLGKIGLAKSNIRTGSGVFLNPDAIFMQPERWEVLAAWGDANARPVVLTDELGRFQAVAGASGSGDVGVEGRTGYVLSTLPVFTDFNIPTPGTGVDQVIVLDTQIVVLYEGAPVSRAVPQTLAGNLQVLIQKYEYLAAFSLYPTAVQTISGTGLTAYGL